MHIHKLPLFTALAAIALFVAPPTGRLLAQSMDPILILSVAPTEEGAMKIIWQSQTNTLYRVEYASELSDPVNWTTLCDQYPSHGTNTFWLDTGSQFHTPVIPHPKNAPTRFYRILNVGINTAPAPEVAISSPSNGVSTSGALTVTVSASTDQATLYTKLYVDGEEMPSTWDSTNYVSAGTNYVLANYVINTCEWPNGQHTLFATAECASDFAGPINVPAINLGHAVSAYSTVTFSNLISRYSWSQPHFDPAAGQTQRVSAVFSANVDWTLQILNASGNAVLTTTGSGTSMAFDWDGTGQGGTNLPAGIYNYLLTAETNGGAFGMAIPGSFGSAAGVGISSVDTGNGSDGWYPHSAREALAAGLESYFVPRPVPRVRTNGVWVPWEEVYGPRPLLEIPVPPSLLAGGQFQAAAASRLAADSLDSDSAPPSETTVGPTRPTTAPVAGVLGTVAIGYQQFNIPVFPGTDPIPFGMQPPLDHQPYPPGHRVQLNGLSGSVGILPLPMFGPEALNFEFQFWKCGWNHLVLANNDLHDYDLQGSGTFLNAANIGLIMTHGAYGTSDDWTASQAQQTYLALLQIVYQPDGSVGHDGGKWVRMSEMDLGSDQLKWVAIDACNILKYENYLSMNEHFIRPFNNKLHVLLGFDTVGWTDVNFEKTWADNMLNHGMGVYDAWLNAGLSSFKGSPDTIRLAVWGWDGNWDDRMPEDLNTPTSGSINYDRQQVWPR